MKTDSYRNALPCRRRRVLAAALCLLLPICAWAGPVSGVTVRQRYPWNGLVDISFSLSEDAIVTVSATDTGTGAVLPVATLSEGGEAIANGQTGLAAGEHRLVWNADTDVPNALHENVEVTVSADNSLYMIIDLTKTDANGKFTISYRSGPPIGGWPVEYKTKKLVLRKIKAGKFRMGSPSSEWGRDTNETLHFVTLTEDFYFSIFEVTLGQLFLVTGESPDFYSWGTQYPARLSSGSAQAYSKASAFAETLSSKAGVSVNLPTEAQWEYACRAGTNTALYTGGNPSCIAELRIEFAGREYFADWGSNGRQSPPLYNGDNTYSIPVGELLPNPWGLYDMCGNLSEVCRDVYVADLSSSSVVDPITTTGSEYYVVRGGDWRSADRRCRSAWRSNGLPKDPFNSSSSDQKIGFRVIVAVPAT